ncbi:MAG: Holliday junction resolvase RuvX [Woeseiaceae bacterium]|nr:Holliday junction resolvase RuvX [Woeseiaceae bacterium]MDX2607747.1 Holliday junction resolvase RuvX [Woeseiaceae bacterium]
MPDTPDFDPKTILAVDFGLRRIGIAVGQSITGSASPLGVVRNSEEGPDFDSLGKLIDEWRPSLIVVGMPRHADDTPSNMTAHVERFIEELRRYDLPIETIDERNTSTEARAVLKNARATGSRGRIKKEMIDSAAAVFIAERYLASHD